MELQELRVCASQGIEQQRCIFWRMGAASRAFLRRLSDAFAECSRLERTRSRFVKIPRELCHCKCKVHRLSQREEMGRCKHVIACGRHAPRRQMSNCITSSQSKKPLQSHFASVSFAAGAALCADSVAKAPVVVAETVRLKTVWRAAFEIVSACACTSSLCAQPLFALSPTTMTSLTERSRLPPFAHHYLRHERQNQQDWPQRQISPRPLAPKRARARLSSLLTKQGWKQAKTRTTLKHSAQRAVVA